MFDRPAGLRNRDRDWDDKMGRAQTILERCLAQIGKSKPGVRGLDGGAVVRIRQLSVYPNPVRKRLEVSVSVRVSGNIKADKIESAVEGLLAAVVAESNEVQERELSARYAVDLAIDVSRDATPATCSPIPSKAAKALLGIDFRYAF